MNQIKIQIIGTAGSGKSTLAWEIADLMKELGLVVSVKDHETDIPEIQVERSLSLYKKDINIKIETMDINRSLIKNVPDMVLYRFRSIDGDNYLIPDGLVELFDSVEHRLVDSVEDIDEFHAICQEFDDQFLQYKIEGNITSIGLWINPDEL